MSDILQDTHTDPDHLGHTIDDRWGAVVLNALTIFVIVTAEMMPVGLLTPMASTLGASEGTVGLTLTITGVIGALVAPFVPAAAGRANRRVVLAALMALVAAANVLTAVASSFALMVVARVVLGVAMAAVWALAAGLGSRLVQEKSVGVATSVIFSGVAVASVLGVPLGTYLGAALGWRGAFWAIAGAALILGGAMLAVLPDLAVRAGSALGGIGRLLGDPRVLAGLVLTGLLVVSHFAAYTYVRPALETFAAAGARLIGTLLLLYGVFGVLGNFAAGARAARRPHATATVLSLTLAAAILSFPSLAVSTVGASLLLAVWGLAYGGVSVTTQTLTAQSAPEHREGVSALWVAVFNLSIAGGALLGGRLLDQVGISWVMWTAGGIALGAGIVAMASSRLR